MQDMHAPLPTTSCLPDSCRRPCRYTHFDGLGRRNQGHGFHDEDVDRLQTWRSENVQAPQSTEHYAVQGSEKDQTGKGSSGTTSQAKLLNFSLPTNFPFFSSKTFIFKLRSTTGMLARKCPNLPQEGVRDMLLCNSESMCIILSGLEDPLLVLRPQ